MRQIYVDTARMMTQVAPLVFASGHFALKGGTAINLFYRDMPRLSVDLDLVFPDHALPRTDALTLIAEEIRAANARLHAQGFQTHTIETSGVGETKLLIRRGGVEVKVEVNFVTRGTVAPVTSRGLATRAQNVLLADLELPVVSLEDVYGGKLVAALDRQHPRDLFDVLQLYANEGLTPGIRRAFIIYLAGHDRPVHEVLRPKFRDIAFDFENHFTGMTEKNVPLAALLAVRDRLVTDVIDKMDNRERQFLLSLVSNTPDWSLLGIDHIDQLPAIRWKLHNLSRLQAMDTKKFTAQRTALEALFH